MGIKEREWKDSSFSYRFGFNGQEKDDEVKEQGNSYTTEFRQYDSRLGRWLSPDPVIKYHESPYAWNTNNPISFIDVLGADSTQRANAINKAEEYVAKNKNPSSSSYKMGAKNAEPGNAIDCSGLITMCAKAGDEPDPNKAVAGGQRKDDGNQSGVLNIEDNTIPVTMDNLVAGNLITWRIKKGYPYHVGIVSEVTRDVEGKVTNVTFIHSSGSLGPNKKSFKVGDGSYYDKQVHGYYKWDTKPDLKTSSSSNIQITANTSNPSSGNTRAEIRENGNQKSALQQALYNAKSSGTNPAAGIIYNILYE